MLWRNICVKDLEVTGRPRIAKDEEVEAGLIETSLDSQNTEKRLNGIHDKLVFINKDWVNLTTFSGRVKDNIAMDLGISRNTLKKKR